MFDSIASTSHGRELSVGQRTAGPAAITFDGASKRFGSVQALDRVSLQIPTGQTVALLGPNGAGKSTAINLMLGLLHADEGQVETLGQTPRRAIAAGRVGAMLQSGGLLSGVTVVELVDCVRHLYPRPMPLEAILRQAGLTDLAVRRVEALSGGETQRVRFAIAMAGDPDLVFLDEPTVSMDVESRHAFWVDMRRFADEGRTVLFATHYLEEADQVADRIVVLDHGKVIADGSPSSIKSSVSGRAVRFTLPGAVCGELSTLPGVTACEVRGDDVILRTLDSDATARALFRADIPARNVEISGAGLEAAFLALTQEAA